MQSHLYIRDARSPLIDLIIYFSFDLVFLVKQRQSSFVYSVKDLLNQNWTNAMFMRDKGNFWVKFLSSEKVFLWPRTIFKVIQPPANYPNLNALICCGCTLKENVFFVLKVFLITVFFFFEIKHLDPDIRNLESLYPFSRSQDLKHLAF